MQTSKTILDVVSFNLLSEKIILNAETNQILLSQLKLP